MGQYELYQESGKHLPEDVSIIGLDDIKHRRLFVAGSHDRPPAAKKDGAHRREDLLDGIEGRSEHTPESWSSRIW